jgi:aspartokinase
VEIEVIKLGGSILQSVETFGRATEIVKNELAQERLPICVVSARKGVTD